MHAVVPVAGRPLSVPARYHDTLQRGTIIHSPLPAFSATGGKAAGKSSNAMKRTLISTATAFLSVTGTACGQQMHTSLAVNKTETIRQGSGNLNYLSTRAVRSFTRLYPDATAVYWYEAQNGFIATFRDGDIACRAAFGLRGNWIYTVRTYTEDKMPKSVRHIVKSTYYDYTITVVEEIIRPREALAYHVHMKDRDTWLNVQVSNGEMIEVEKFQKREGN